MALYGAFQLTIPIISPACRSAAQVVSYCHLDGRSGEPGDSRRQDND
jgi:hypothetical protein